MAESGPEVRLSRSLGLFTVTMMGVGGMIGAGIFALTGIAAGEAGPAIVVVFALNGAVTFLTALAYAELGSAFPRAGGGYAWVKEGLGGANGFLAGWMAWFGYIVAGALYGIAFGRFAADAWTAMGLPTAGLATQELETAATVLVIFGFTVLNVIGAEETGAMGAAITVVKVAILFCFIAFGFAVMAGSPELRSRFEDFAPNGAAGVLIAMGLTFIAFEGYEIIAQSGEEIIRPARNVPRGIFLSIGIAVAIYVLIAIVATGATTPPAGMTVHDYLGQERELAVVHVASQIFPFGSGAALMLLSGLAATMSALNVTIFSASRVSFAMGREHNLPAALARVHRRWLTPFVSVLTTGGLMLVAGLLLPIETAATAGSLMFLLMFIQVNVVVMTLRQTHPEVARGFRVPVFPLPALAAIAANAALVIYMITFNPTAVWMAFVWIVVGLLAYYMHFEHRETVERPRSIVLEEAVGEQAHTVLLAVRDEREAKLLGWFGAAVAKAREGGLLVSHMLEVPRSLSLEEGGRYLSSGRTYFERVREEASARHVGVHALIMIARKVARAISEIVAERGSDLVVLAWRGKSKRGRIFGSTSDELLVNPPADIAIVRAGARKKSVVRTIVVPVSRGPNSRLAVDLATDIGPVVAGRAHARITLLRVVRPDLEDDSAERALIDELLRDIDYRQVETKIVRAKSVANAIIQASADFDLLIFGASEEPLLKRIAVGNIGKRIMRHAAPTTVMVKRRQPVLHSYLRRIILPPR